MTILLEEYFGQRKQKYLADIEEQKNVRQQLEGEIKANEDQLEKLQTERNRKAKLVKATQAENVDATQLISQVADLDRELAQLNANVTSKREAIANMPVLRFDEEARLMSVLKNVYSCEQAILVSSADECWSFLPLEISEMDKLGRPSECTIGLGFQPGIQFKIKSGRFCNGFRSEILSWIPEMNKGRSASSLTHHNSENPKIYAFLEKGDSHLILSTTELSWQIKLEPPPSHSSWYPSENRVKFEDVHEDFSKIAVSLQTRLESFMKDFNGELDLDNNCADNPVIRWIKDFVNQQTKPDPIFEPAKEGIISADIYKTIKNHWDALRDCPWSNEIRGRLALLKYSIENGEKARFWVEAFKNHYGFRMRTRDHDWIRGLLYIGTSSNEQPPRPALKVHSVAGHNIIASLGSMWLYVGVEREERRC